MPTGYYAWMMVSTVIVLMMTTPALALFYGGMTRSKSILNMMMMSYISVGIVGIIYVLWGWSMYVAGDDILGLFGNPIDAFALKGVGWEEYIPGVMFQMTFAAITAALISGAIADRVKFSAWVLFVPLWATLVYFPIAHMVWGGGIISQWFEGAQDYAGGTVVHINAGIAGLVLALIIGKRVGWPKEPMRPHSLPLTMIGAGLLWVGWYGFNVGSIVLGGESTAADEAQFMTETGSTFVATTVATCAAMLAWLVVEKILHGKATSLGAASGIVAGLVAITPACGSVGVLGAIIIGAVAGAACAWAVSLKYKLGYDDSLDVVGVHLVGGLLGTLLIGFVSTDAAPNGVNGLFYGGGIQPLLLQAGAAATALVWSGVITAIIAFAIKFTIGWRPSEEDEVAGVDLSEHGESAYDFSSGAAGTNL